MLNTLMFEKRLTHLIICLYRLSASGWVGVHWEREREREYAGINNSPSSLSLTIPLYYFPPPLGKTILRRTTFSLVSECIWIKLFWKCSFSIMLYSNLISYKDFGDTIHWKNYLNFLFFVLLKFNYHWFSFDLFFTGGYHYFKS